MAIDRNKEKIGFLLAKNRKKGIVIRWFRSAPIGLWSDTDRKKGSLKTISHRSKTRSLHTFRSLNDSQSGDL